MDLNFLKLQSGCTLFINLTLFNTYSLLVDKNILNNFLSRYFFNMHLNQLSIIFFLGLFIFFFLFQKRKYFFFLNELMDILHVEF